MNEENYMTPESFKRIAELLETRDTLTDIAVVQYGDAFVEHEEFWGSVTERQMGEVVMELIELGYVEKYDEATRSEADRIWRKFFGNQSNNDLED
jgi:hypothetical protein